MKVEKLKCIKDLHILKFSLIMLGLIMFSFQHVAAVETEEIGLNSRGESSTLLEQQDGRVVKGSVVDSSGESLIAVSVVVKGTTVGTATDFDGNFQIVLPEGNNELEISYLGFKTVIVNVAGKSSISVVMHEDTQALDELVVTALGIKRSEKALSYNVQQVGSDDLNKAKDANFMNSLNGKVAGVTINASSSGVGGATRVVMRGAKSISGNNNVLYVIDGMPMGNPSGGTTSGAYDGMVRGEGISDINPDDIESINVLSGPSAAALYGSAAANGVILINTKKGQEGKMKITLSNTTDFMNPFIMPRFQNRYGSNKPFGSWGEKLEKPSTHNPIDFFQTGLSTISSVSLSAGNKTNQMYLSYANTEAKGIIPNNGYSRHNLTMRQTVSLLNDKLHLDGSASYIVQSDRNMMAQGVNFNPLVPLYLFPRGDDFDNVKSFTKKDLGRNLLLSNWDYGNQGFAMQNPYWIVYKNLHETNKDRYMFYLSAAYDITDYLTISTRGRIDNSFTTYEKKYHAGTDTDFASLKGHYTQDKFSYTQQYFDMMLSFNKYWGDISASVNAGGIYEGYIHDMQSFGGHLITIPNLFSFGNVDPTLAIPKQTRLDAGVNIGFFGSAEIGYKSMLYLSLTERYDINSHLVNTKSMGFSYPSVGLSAVLTEMMPTPKFLDYMKVRGSYTQVGKPIEYFGKTEGTITYNIAGGAVVPLSTYPFTDYKPERTTSYELGIDMKFFKNRLGLDLTIYHSNTFNQTFLSDLSATSGYSGFYIQAGNVQNRGLELALSYNEKFGDFGVSSTITMSKNKNKILELVKEYPNPLDRTDLVTITEATPAGGRIKEGDQIGDLYATSILQPKKDEDGELDLSSFSLKTVDAFKIGTTNPNLMMGWRNEFSYKGVSLSMLFNARFGGVVTSTTEAYLDRFGASERSAQMRDNGGVAFGDKLLDPKAYYEIIGGGIEGAKAYYVYGATNIRLQELVLSWNLPSKWFSNVLHPTVSLVGKNLLMFYNEAPFDPQLTASTGTYNQGNDFFMPPSLRSFGFNVKFQF